MAQSDPHAPGSPAAAWPALPLAAWRDTYATLHMWTQIVGKTRLALAPMENHWWQVGLYVTARGLTTSPMPCGERSVEVEFDFIDHALALRTSDGTGIRFALSPRSVADFYALYMDALRMARRRAGAHGIAGRGRNGDPVRPGPHARVVRRRRRAALLADLPARTASSSGFAVASSASRARCTSSGAASTWRRRAFPAERRRAIRVGRRTAPTT